MGRHISSIYFKNILIDKKLSEYVALKGIKLDIRNNIVACYNAELAAGDMIICKTCNSRTGPNLSAIAELSRLAKMLSPYLDIMGDQSKYINDIRR